MQILLNGESVAAEEGTSLLSLLRSQGFDLDAVAVLLNSSVVEKSKLALCCPTDGDAVDVVSFMAGG